MTSLSTRSPSLSPRHAARDCRPFSLPLIAMSGALSGRVHVLGVLVLVQRLHASLAVPAPAAPPPSLTSIAVRTSRTTRALTECSQHERGTQTQREALAAFALSARAPLVPNARDGAHTFERVLRIDRTLPLFQVDRECAATRFEEGARSAFQSNLIFAAEVAALRTCSNTSLTSTHYRRRERLALTRAAPSFPKASSFNQHAHERPHEHSIVLKTLGRTPPPYVAKDPAHNLWRSAAATLKLRTACVRTRTSHQPQRRHSFRSQTGTLHKYSILAYEILLNLNYSIRNCSV